MSGFTDALAGTADELGGNVAPPKVIKLPLSAWNPTFTGRPECDIPVGLRLPGSEDAETIEAEAVRSMREAMADGEEAALRAYNESKLVSLVALCITDPNDVTAPHELFETPNALLKIALTPQGLRRLFDEIELLQVETSPIFHEASDDDVSVIAELLGDGALTRLQDQVKASRARRYLTLVFETLADGQT